MEKKESYLVFNGVRYDAVNQDPDAIDTCNGCAFYKEGNCTIPCTYGYNVDCDCDGDRIFTSKDGFWVTVQQQPKGQNEKDSHEEPVIVGEIHHAKYMENEIKNEKAIGKRSYYSFPNGVEAEDICRYLPFNLGNVVKYVCRVRRMEGYKKIEDLESARDYLDNEIERMKEEFDNEIKRMKEKIAKENKGR